MRRLALIALCGAFPAQAMADLCKHYEANASNGAACQNCILTVTGRGGPEPEIQSDAGWSAVVEGSDVYGAFGPSAGAYADERFNGTLTHTGDDEIRISMTIDRTTDVVLDFDCLEDD